MKNKTKELIEKEQVYQEDKWVDHNHTVGEWLIILGDLLRKANQNWLTKGDTACLNEVIQLAATAVTCLDEQTSKAQGRKLCEKLQRIYEDRLEFPKEPLLKGVDKLSSQVQKLTSELRVVNQELNIKNAKISTLESEIQSLRIRLQEALFDNFPPIKPKYPRPSNPMDPPYEPWRFGDQPGWNPNPIITCETKGNDNW